MKKQTELIRGFINPDFLEAIKQPLDSIEAECYYSLKFKRGGEKFSMTMYDGGNGKVNISKDSTFFDGFPSVILSDHCKTVKDLQDMFERLDEMIHRMPQK